MNKRFVLGMMSNIIPVLSLCLGEYILARYGRHDPWDGIAEMFGFIIPAPWALLGVLFIGGLAMGTGTFSERFREVRNGNDFMTGLCVIAAPITIVLAAIGAIERVV